IFEQAENAGSEITYRCINCRDCKDCKNNASTESISIREEIEQQIINRSVTIDIANRTSYAHLPLLHKPEVKLSNNKHKALKVYYQQLKKLDNNPSDKADVLLSEKKMHTLGFVDYVENMTPSQQNLLNDSEIVNYIPWRAVWKPNSLSTPCRVVFDASQPTNSGYSLNDILAKGTNNMNSLIELLIRWTSHQTVFHTDVRKMYNSVKLVESHWCLQRYIWEENLDRTRIPKEKIIKTLIYGVKSSGNQSERALRGTARLSKDEYPDAYEVITKDVYVDDCLSGAESMSAAIKLADGLEVVVNRGGFALMEVTFSKQTPDKDSLPMVKASVWLIHRTGDASKHIACVAIYARFKRKSGGYSSQLVFSRSRLVPDAHPHLARAELYAATLNAHTGEVVRRAFQKHHQSSLKLTDSQIVLFWLHSDKQLKPYVRNRVNEVHRFTNPDDWRFVKSQDMIADIGTRKGVSLNEICQDSKWFNGFPWMKRISGNLPNQDC
ncbi:uncharacterized protein, partial [Clytia hemisphaerica]|uniref:uncharacterized protein n=1 Tax=Clytia hemisphaerica TaxID=252671 RepID=UPI0034D68FF0